MIEDFCADCEKPCGDGNPCHFCGEPLCGECAAFGVVACCDECAAEEDAEGPNK